MHASLTTEGPPESSPTVRMSYIVCSIPRSGSTLLCDLLERTGVAGVPDEHFHPVTMKTRMREWEVDSLDDYLRCLLARMTGINGVFGTKLHWGQFRPTFADPDPRKILPNPRFLYITRRDHVRQAVSWVRALQTRKWASGHEPPVKLEPAFDAQEIARKIGRIENDERGWEQTFDRYAITPHRVVYEDLAADRAQTMHGVMEFLGLTVPDGFDFAPPALARQSDETSERWVRLYLGGDDSSGHPPPG